MGFVVCFGYIQSLNKECPEPEQRVGFVVCFGYIQSEFCCLFWLYPEQRVSFVVCFGYIQSLNEEWLLLFALVISRV